MQYAVGEFPAELSMGGNGNGAFSEVAEEKFLFALPTENVQIIHSDKGKDKNAQL